ncbi:MAG: NAD-binding protein [Treponema sp.]|nr:NAD-binding protein [Treponema sp.]
MRIIIVGAGHVGTQLARQLIDEKHDVAIIESNEERARHVSNRLDCMVLNDEGNSINALEEASIANADALICVTNSDEVNIITCGLAARYPKVLKIARVRNDEYIQQNFRNADENGNTAPLGVDYFIHPDAEAASTVLDAIEHGAIGNIVSFPGTPYVIGVIDVMPGSSFDNLVLKNFHTLIKEDSLVTLLERKGESIIPTGATQLLAGDRIYLMLKEDELDKGFELAGYHEKIINKIGIVGGGRLGCMIASGILGTDSSGKKLDSNELKSKNKENFLSFIKGLGPRKYKKLIIIEQNKDICKDLADRFPGTLILNEDISDENFIAEEQMDNLDLIITSTNHQELNIITAVYLKSRGVGRAIAMVNSTGYAAIARRLGVDVVIPMKSVVIDSIMSRLIGGNVKGVHRLGDGSLTILMVEISQGCRAEGKSLEEFTLPGDALVMLVKRKDEGDFIPNGTYVYTAGHQLLMIARNGTETEIEKIFGTSDSRQQEDNQPGEES